MYFFKSNLASHFSSMWKWSNIHLSSKTILQNYISEISNNKNSLIKLGMKTKYVPRKIGKGVWCYAERGEKKLNHLSRYNKHQKKITIGI